MGEPAFLPFPAVWLTHRRRGWRTAGPLPPLGTNYHWGGHTQWCLMGSNGADRRSRITGTMEPGITVLRLHFLRLGSHCVWVLLSEAMVVWVNGKKQILCTAQNLLKTMKKTQVRMVEGLMHVIYHLERLSVFFLHFGALCLSSRFAHWPDALLWPSWKEYSKEAGERGGNGAKSGHFQSHWVHGLWFWPAINHRPFMLVVSQGCHVFRFIQRRVALP